MRAKVLLAVTFAAVSLGALFLTSERSNAARPNFAIAASTPKPKAKSDAITMPFVDEEFDGVALIRTDADWKKVLSPSVFYITRNEGTEQAYTGSLLKNHGHGVYYCAACHLALFRSTAKYDSQTGWPSFYQPAYKKNVVEKEDKSLSESRTEVECARCGAHLGHVFDDGPQPTGLRYCMNSAALVFKKTAKK